MDARGGTGAFISHEQSELDPLLLLAYRLALAAAAAGQPAGEEQPPAVLDVCADPPRAISLVQLLCAAARLAVRMREAIRADSDVGAGLAGDEVSFVGIVVREGPLLVLGPLAALLCGFAFVLMDPCTPSERLRFQLEDTRARLLLVASGGDDGERADSAESGFGQGKYMIHCTGSNAHQRVHGMLTRTLKILHLAGHVVTSVSGTTSG